MLYSTIIKNTQMQDFLVAWMNWYYGDGEYPLELQNGLRYDQRIEAIAKTEKIKKIVGR
jgi:hypothetical protein